MSSLFASGSCKAMQWIAVAIALFAQVAQSALVDTGGVHGFTDPTPLIHNNDVSSAACIQCICNSASATLPDFVCAIIVCFLCS
jgi:hypothetical protein